MSEPDTLIGYGGRTIGREELAFGADTGGPDIPFATYDDPHGRSGH